jgi:UPF0716 protein FxsA
VFARLALLFVIVPLVELVLLLRLGAALGFLPTLGLVILTGVAGAALARREGWRAFQRFSSSLARGEVPTDAMLDGLAVMLGGTLLVTPGVLTDLVGLGLLLPPARRIFKRRVVAAVKNGIALGTIQVTTHGFNAWTGSRAGGVADPLRNDPREIVVNPPEDGMPGA